MGIHVVAVYQPKPDQAPTLEAEAANHVPTLRRLGLATDTPALVLRAPDGTLVEHFEWVDQAAIDSAHQHPEVLEMWGRYETCCEFKTLADLPNATQPFAEFELVGIY